MGLQLALEAVESVYILLSALIHRESELINRTQFVNNYLPSAFLLFFFITCQTPFSTRNFILNVGHLTAR